MTRRNRSEPGGRKGDGFIPDAGVCGSCSKWRYFKRADAKRAARRFHPGDHLSVYPCPVNTAYWHFGHLPGPVLTGDAGRDEIRNVNRRRAS